MTLPCAPRSGRHPVRGILLAALIAAGGLVSTGNEAVWAEGMQLSGGVDARFERNAPPERNDFRLAGLFLNLRKIWSDEEGDRWIAVAQADAENDFRTIRPYQAYLQYKGPLGRWNVRGGHFLLPFGLLATYDTERLLLQGLERTSLGIRKDTGMGMFGRFGDWDYSVAVTEGVGDRRLSDVDRTPLATGRLAYVGEDLQIGFSALAGRVLPERESAELFDRSGGLSERRLALDLTKTAGPLTIRIEGAGGTDAGRGVGGGIVLADYALTPKTDLNTRYAYWRKDGDRHSAGLGLTYQIVPGLAARVGDNYEFGKEDNNEFAVQLYYEFGRSL